MWGLRHHEERSGEMGRGRTICRNTQLAEFSFHCWHSQHRVQRLLHLPCVVRLLRPVSRMRGRRTEMVERDTDAAEARPQQIPPL